MREAGLPREDVLCPYGSCVGRPLLPDHCGGDECCCHVPGRPPGRCVTLSSALPGRGRPG
jgi:hypothetical protein